MKRISLIAIAILGLAGCDGLAEFTGPGNQSFVVGNGAAFTITLQTIGFGQYDAPPVISSPIVRFVEVSQAAVVVPAGPTQVFRFQAVGTGEAIIVFRNSAQNRSVADTILVR